MGLIIRNYANTDDNNGRLFCVFKLIVLQIVKINETKRNETK